VEDVIFPDDNFNAIKTAKVAGMHVYGVYDDSSAEYVDDMKSISDVLEIIKRAGFVGSLQEQ
jgi:hypothetical protein